jgi:serine/threonine protein kinase
LAPEVIGGFYGKECDIWSMGVVIYQMLTGKMPFNGSSMKDLIDLIQIGDFEMPD